MSNPLQYAIMQVIIAWGKRNNEAIPLKEIIDNINTQQQFPESTIRASLQALVRKRYIRRAISISNKVAYVQLRTV